MPRWRDSSSFGVTMFEFSNALTFSPGRRLLFQFAPLSRSFFMAAINCVVFVLRRVDGLTHLHKTNTNVNAEELEEDRGSACSGQFVDRCRLMCSESERIKRKSTRDDTFTRRRECQSCNATTKAPNEKHRALMATSEEDEEEELAASEQAKVRIVKDFHDQTRSRSNISEHDATLK